MIKIILNAWYLFLKLILRKNIFIHNSAKIYFPRVVTKDNGSIVIEDNVRMEQRGHLETYNESRIQIKYNSSANYNCQFYGDVFIGEYCILASEVYMSSFNHDFKSNPAIPIKFADKLYPKISDPIYIENDVWIGKNTYIGPGVYIAKGCVIGANLKITKSIYEPFTIVYNDYPLKHKKRFVLTKKQSIVAEQNCLPYFYRGFRYQFEDQKLNSVIGEDVVFIIPFELSENINITLDVPLEQIKSIKSIEKNRVFFNKLNYDCDLIVDVNLIKLSKRINFNLVQIVLNKEVNFESLKIST